MKKPDVKAMKADAFDQLSMLARDNSMMKVAGYINLADATRGIVERTRKTIETVVAKYEAAEDDLETRFDELFGDWRGKVCLAENIPDVDDKIDAAICVNVGVVVSLPQEDTPFTDIFNKVLEALPEAK